MRTVSRLVTGDPQKMIGNSFPRPFVSLKGINDTERFILPLIDYRLKGERFTLRYGGIIFAENVRSIPLKASISGKGKLPLSSVGEPERFTLAKRELLDLENLVKCFGVSIGFRTAEGESLVYRIENPVLTTTPKYQAIEFASGWWEIEGAEFRVKVIATAFRQPIEAVVKSGQLDRMDSDAVEALVALGYGIAVARKALKDVPDKQDLSTDKLIIGALRQLSPGLAK